MTENQAFEDIRIVDFDEELSYNPDPSRDLYEMYVELSDTPPAEWQRIFDAEWEHQLYSMRRRARIEGKHVVIRCVPEEVEQHHLPKLKESVKSSNVKYREYLERVAENQAREEHEKEAEAQRLRVIKDRLDFD